MQANVEYHPTSLNKRAVALVAHGLNLKPAAMLPMAEWLNSKGADVYLVKLSGHFENSVGIKGITATMWEEEMLYAYTIAKEASVKYGVPLFFVGFSLGALLGQAVVCFSKKAACFDKQVLLAPATAIRSRGYLLKYLYYLNKRLGLPSFTPKRYRANNFLPLTAFEVVFRNERNIINAQFDKLNIPTLIFIDPKDELISHKKLLGALNKYGLTNYEIVTLDSNLKARYGQFHHLIVSEHTMGKKNWELATKKMTRFLFDTGE